MVAGGLGLGKEGQGCADRVTFLYFFILDLLYLEKWGNFISKYVLKFCRKKYSMMDKIKNNLMNLFVSKKLIAFFTVSFICTLKHFFSNLKGGMNELV